MENIFQQIELEQAGLSRQHMSTWGIFTTKAVQCPCKRCDSAFQGVDQWQCHISMDRQPRYCTWECVQAMFRSIAPDTPQSIRNMIEIRRERLKGLNQKHKQQWQKIRNAICTANAQEREALTATLQKRLHQEFCGLESSVSLPDFIELSVCSISARDLFSLATNAHITQLIDYDDSSNLRVE